MTVNEIFNEQYHKALPSPIEVRPFNAEKTRSMRALNPQDVDQLISVVGMVTRTTALIPEMRQGFFQCFVCDYVVSHLWSVGLFFFKHECNSLKALTVLFNFSKFRWKMKLIEAALKSRWCAQIVSRSTASISSTIGLSSWTNKSLSSRNLQVNCSFCFF